MTGCRGMSSPEITKTQFRRLLRGKKVYLSHSENEYHQERISHRNAAHMFAECKNKWNIYIGESGVFIFFYAHGRAAGLRPELVYLSSYEGERV